MDGEEFERKFQKAYREAQQLLKDWRTRKGYAPDYGVYIPALWTAVDRAHFHPRHRNRAFVRLKKRIVRELEHNIQPVTQERR